LIGLDKEDIVKLSKEIGTYDLSILKSQDCSAVPNKPATKAKLEAILKEEKKIDIEKLVNNAIKQSSIIRP
jgi:thiamine biosynthesis protein ThiI